MARDTFEDVDYVEAEARSSGAFGGAIVIVTAVVLLAAIFLMQKALRDHFNQGLLADKAARTPPAATP